MQLFYGPVNKQRHRALDTRNSGFVSANVSFRCTLKPYVVYICKIEENRFVFWVMVLGCQNYYRTDVVHL